MNAIVPGGPIHVTRDGPGEFTVGPVTRDPPGPCRRRRAPASHTVLLEAPAGAGLRRAAANRQYPGPGLSSCWCMNDILIQVIPAGLSVHDTLPVNSVDITGMIID